MKLGEYIAKVRGVHSVLKFLPYSLQKCRRFGGWRYLLSNSGGGEIFRTHPDQPRNPPATFAMSRLHLKCDGTRAETRFRLSAKRTSPFKSAGASTLAAVVCTSAVVMQDTPCSEVVWRVLATHSIRQFPLHFPYLPHRVPSHLNCSLIMVT